MTNAIEEALKDKGVHAVLSQKTTPRKGEGEAPSYEELLDIVSILVRLHDKNWVWSTQAQTELVKDIVEVARDAKNRAQHFLTEHTPAFKR